MKGTKYRVSLKEARLRWMITAILICFILATVLTSSNHLISLPLPSEDEIPHLERYPLDIWADRPTFHNNNNINTTTTNAHLHMSYSPSQLKQLLTPSQLTNLTSLCARCLYHTLTTSVSVHDHGHWTFVATGDIPEMWIRDSAVQIGVYIPLIHRRPFIQEIIEGAIRSQSYFILQDPYANAYKDSHRLLEDPQSWLFKDDRILGRSGWVGSRNYEMDSGAYFFNFLWNFYSAPDVYSPSLILSEPSVIHAVELMLDIWIIEQHHERKSTYRYSELPRNGRGPKTGFTGMSWTGFRPSDDKATYGYNIPVNIYAAGALQRIIALNRAVWDMQSIHNKARGLLTDITKGINTHGIVEAEPGIKVYAYEVDGLGNALFDFDDSNIPSLLSIPMLGWDGYDADIYATTRRRLLDPKYNKYYFKGQIEGIGSPHTPEMMVWPLSMMVQALTSTNLEEQAKILKDLILLQCGNGLMHESVHVENLQQCTRPVFEWANAMLVTTVEHLLELDCDKYAEKHRLKVIQAREKKDSSAEPRNGGKDDPLYYENLQASVMHGISVEERNVWKKGMASFDYNVIHLDDDDVKSI